MKDYLNTTRGVTLLSSHFSVFGKNSYNNNFLDK
jgi:hypothetical protein